MTIAFLLRVLSAQAEQGKVVGCAEVVETGQTFAFRDASELTALLLQLSGAELSQTDRSLEISIAEAPA